MRTVADRHRLAAYHNNTANDLVFLSDRFAASVETKLDDGGEISSAAAAAAGTGLCQRLQLAASVVPSGAVLASAHRRQSPSQVRSVGRLARGRRLQVSGGHEARRRSRGAGERQERRRAARLPQGNVAIFRPPGTVVPGGLMFYC